jgi:SNF2 family DNA or RNA helicase
LTSSIPIPTPVTNLELYDFQQEMVDKFSNPKYPNVLCGDDMGLGKTVEALTLDAVKRAQRYEKVFSLTGKAPVEHAKTLIIATAGGVHDAWEKNINRFFPGLEYVTLNPKDRPPFAREVQKGNHDVYLMHWDALRLMPEVADEVWFHIIADEVHKVKNRKAQVTRALKRIKAINKIGLTGTPADNKPHDLWSILNWLYPGTFRSYWAFYKMYVEFKKHPVHGYNMVTGVRNEKHLQRTIEPFFIRRRKEEVLEDLPDKYYTVRWVDLSTRQRKAYEQMRKRQLAWVGENEAKPLSAPIVATQLMRLQQFACADVDIETVTRRVKNKKFDPHEPEVLEQDLSSDIPLSYQNWKWRHIKVPEYKLVEPSSKLDEVMEVLDECDNMPVVIWSQFSKMCQLLGRRLEAAGISHGLFTGNQNKSDRDQLVDNFQAGRRRVFVGTIKAGGESITLTRSCTEVFVDRSWSASANRQAEDRLHRIGQVNAVQVIDILARNTVDLGRKTKIEQKWTWVQKLLGDKVLDYQKELVEDGNDSDR